MDRVRAFTCFGLAIVLSACNAVLGNESGDFVPDLTTSGGAFGGAGRSGTSGSTTGGGGHGGAAEDAALGKPDAAEGGGAAGSQDGGTEASVRVDADASPVVDASTPDAKTMDARDEGARTDAAVDAFRCANLDGCATGYNCDKGVCVPATVSCAAHKSAYPSSGDGVYWINPTGTPMRAYCDMQLQSELCTEIEADHRGKTRDGSNLPYTMRSILHARDAKCSIWAVRGSTDGYPIRAIEMVEGQKLGTCQALGFPSDVMLGECAFGDSAGYSNCGFALSPPLYQWGNHCSGCMIGDGLSPTYVKQGPMHSSTVLSTADGSVQSHCAVK
jgi:hypothetical protein